jgi:hypothetical protein
MIKKGVRVNTATETLDMVATFLDYAGVSIPAEMNSRTLRPFLETLRGYPRKYAVSALEDWSLVYDGRYKFIRSRSSLYDCVGSADSGKSQVLYDLLNDPGETKDIAPANDAIVSRLQQYLQAPGHTARYISKDTIPPDSVPCTVLSTAVTQRKNRSALSVSLSPNPFSKTVRIRLPALANDAAEITITTMRGATVRQWRMEKSATGAAEVAWNGHDEHGATVAPGMYAVHIRCGTTAISRMVNKSGI